MTIRNKTHRINVYLDDASGTYWAECGCGEWRTRAVYSSTAHAREAGKDHLDLVR